MLYNIETAYMTIKQTLTTNKQNITRVRNFYFLLIQLVFYKLIMIFERAFENLR